MQYILISLYATESITYGNLFGAIILHKLSITMYKILTQSCASITEKRINMNHAKQQNNQKSSNYGKIIIFYHFGFPVHHMNVPIESEKKVPKELN